MMLLVILSLTPPSFCNLPWNILTGEAMNVLEEIEGVGGPIWRKAVVTKGQNLGVPPRQDFQTFKFQKPGVYASKEILLKSPFTTVYSLESVLGTKLGNTTWNIEFEADNGNPFSSSTYTSLQNNFLTGKPSIILGFRVKPANTGIMSIVAVIQLSSNLPVPTFPIGTNALVPSSKNNNFLQHPR